MNNITTTSTSTLSTVNQNTPIAQLINTYLDTVKTSKGTTPSDSDKMNFITFCLANQINPIKKQAYLMGYDSKNGPSFSTIVSISGYTAIAMQTGLCAGIDQPRFTYNGNQLDSCSITVYRLVKGEKCGFSGTAYYSERVGKKYDGSLTEPWAKQPKTMLEKCAKAAALRNAFPDQLSGVYTEDEMPKADVEVEAKKIEIEYVTSPQLALILKQLLPKRALQLELTIEELQNKICDTVKVKSLTELTKKEAKNLIDTLINKIDTHPVPNEENIEEIEGEEAQKIENLVIELTN
jgi:phage recombination protein Bet